MSNMVTRCPKCATSFRITSAQLQSAKGAVRCGSCLHIFKAQDHLLSVDAPVKKTATPAASPAPATKTAPAVAAPATPKTPPGPPVPEPKTAPEQPLFSQAEIDDRFALDDDDILISDDMDQANIKPEVDDIYGVNEFIDAGSTPLSSVSLFERNPRDIPNKDQDTTDESWAESLLDEVIQEDKIDAVKREIAEAEDDYGDLTDDSDEYDTNPDEYLETSPYSSHMFSLVNDDEPTDSSVREIFTDEELSEELRALGKSEPTPPPAAAPVVEPPPLHAYDTSRAALLMNIMPEPVVMTSRRKRGWRQRKIWSALSIVMILVLIVQVAWLQFDNLSRIHPYRAGYEFICPYLGCQVPVLVDRSLIRVRNLLVRKHPDADNALMVDVILLNNAPFNQPFPDLVMAFSDIDGRPVATRRFAPREYLAGELAGLELMPQNQPIHISLELVDPGEQAVNYKIEPY